MAKKSGKVYVIGHKNPDTDSICSAIAYAELKKTITGEEYVARRAGQISIKLTVCRRMFLSRIHGQK